MKKLYSFFLIGFVLLIFTACPQSEVESEVELYKLKMKFDGFVKDAETLSPINGAHVVLHIPGLYFDSSGESQRDWYRSQWIIIETNRNGYYSCSCERDIEPNQVGAAAPDMSIKVSAQGYNDFYCRDFFLISEKQTTDIFLESSQIKAPTLISPREGDMLDNGCSEGSDTQDWDFEWSRVPGATRYHLYVMGENAIFPVINNSNIWDTQYSESKKAYIVERHRYNWTWKVRAFGYGKWGEWSEVRSFDVERMCED